ncbi:alpha/beta fold hydrolase [Actinophytocola oryzae]|uniref:Alpha-beta hydrolase superfamily lysophospholipase n=1 Tax=Actinophytocola oryzae TaxID=502181 RepID=A0A4V3FR05_9PSEU|nr:alpha/beta hydrolase [Actinophytocola oryzae]TDV41721.1 alpha-beta hydrolase superfamily lysophospholipase [Actinophytocola oryzae]
MVISKDGTTIAVDRVGDGPAVVCVGGALNDRHATGWVAAELTGFTVHSYDRRGRGDSGDTPPYSVDREIEDLASVVEHAGGEAAVYGMSSGAILALRAALAGVPITRLALYEPPFTATVAPDYAERLAAATPAEALELFLDSIGVPLETVTPYWDAMVALAPTLRYDAAVVGDATIPPVDTLTIPVTVLVGGASPEWMRRAGRTLAVALPSGAVTELPNQTHNVDPQALAKALTSAFTE